jgi:hypothetical protein
MLNHFLRITLRNLAKSRVYSIINIAGLTVGLAGFIVVLLYLNHELNYDRWSPELKKVYKISARTDEEVREQCDHHYTLFKQTAFWANRSYRKDDPFVQCNG